MNNEQLRQSISDCSVDIRNKYKEISPLLFLAKWMPDESNIVSIGNPTFGIIGDDQSIPEVEIANTSKRLNTVTVGAKCAVSKSLLNKNDFSKEAIIRAFAIGTKEAIENILFYGNPSDSIIPSIMSTGTIKTISGTSNLQISNLTEMYKSLDPVNLSGAIWMVSKDIRDLILDTKHNEASIEFQNGRLYFMGVPVFVSENFSEEKGIVAVLINPFDVTMRCTLFDDEQGLVELTEMSATNNATEFLSIFDCAGVVDKKDSAIILKVEKPIATSKSRKATSK